MFYGEGVGEEGWWVKCAGKEVGLCCVNEDCC